ncbi:(Fe-S)-binding protein [Desulfosediminicola ganghwensis]|uniref:(Fe-S)-binding protein n=1 Tax=Desulfosediminicola ganghwensis TaxID=2569540 RepID=UPI0010AD4FDA|nr:(Fe-S)-binding protein [Desulfosediminicola ganghwensis]
MRESSGNCGKCGICLSVCPVYKVLKEEQASPRARVQLIRAYGEKRLASTPLLKELIAKCLMCGSCAANCPSGVDHYSSFMEMRSRLIDDHGDRLEIRGLVYLLARERRLRMAMGMARMGQGVLPDRVAARFKLGNIAVDRFPRLNSRQFRKTVPEEIAPAKEAGQERGTVLYFTGCASNYIYGETGEAVVGLLTRLGYRVIIPREQSCCSVPMLYHGGVDEALTNIEQNIKSFHRPDIKAIIVDCPTCGSALKHEFAAMMERFDRGELMRQKALDIAEKTLDIMSFVYSHLSEMRFSRDSSTPIPEGPVSYHLPCHLKNSFVSAERVLNNIAEVDYVAAEDTSECCGGGGTFFYEYPEVAGKIAGSKIDNIRRTGAKTWLTDCPVCRINLSARLDSADDITMMHPAKYLQQKLVDVIREEDGDCDSCNGL